MTSRTVLVTGASRGIGRATAIAFARNGFDRVIFQLAETSSRKIARDAADTCRIGAIGRQIDFDDGIAKAGEINITLTGCGRFG